MQRAYVGLLAILFLTGHLGTTTISPLYAAEAAPKVKVISQNTFIDENSFLNIVGLIKNIGENVGPAPTVRVILYDKNGDVLNRLKDDPFIKFMNTGTVSPFKITVKDTLIVKKTNSFTIKLEEKGTSPKLPEPQRTPKPSSLTIESIQLRTDNSNITRITGDIKNNGNRLTSTFTVAVAFMNSNNQVLDAKFIPYDNPIVAGEKLSFEMSYNGYAEKYCVVADSRDYVSRPVGSCETVEGKKSISPPNKTKTPTPANEKPPISSNTTVTLSKFAVVDTNKTKLKEVRIGQQVMLQSKASNNMTSYQPFTYIVQVKNSENITVMLAWMSGELSPRRSFDLAVSWIPEKSGKYNIEIFAWKDITNPVPLSASPIRTSIEVRA
ncbi:MAG: hypothetical protein QXU32_09570 [Nitrososphaerales archaeon]